MLRVVRTLAAIAVAAMAVVGVETPKAEAAELNLNTGAGAESVIMQGSNSFYKFAGALWSTSAAQPTFTGGTSQPFLYIIDKPSTEHNGRTADGHNTGSTSFKNEETSAHGVTRNVLSDDLQGVKINGEYYYQFMLDINQSSTTSNEAILRGLQICTAGSGNKTQKDKCPGATGNETYTLGSGNSVKLKTGTATSTPLNPPDLYVYIPVDTLFPNGISEAKNNDFLYLWSSIEHSAYKDGCVKNGQFKASSKCSSASWDKWGYLGGDWQPDAYQGPAVPEPTTLVMLGTGLLFSAAMVRRRNRQQAAANTKSAKA